VNLMRGAQREAAYRAVNPMMALPALIDGEGPRSCSSRWRSSNISTRRARGRARVRGLAQIVACDSHPLIYRAVQFGNLDSTGGQALAYVFFEDKPGRRAAASLLSKDETRSWPGSFPSSYTLMCSHHAFGEHCLCELSCTTKRATLPSSWTHQHYPPRPATFDSMCLRGIRESDWPRGAA
jgi:hypothetical protein